MTGDATASRTLLYLHGFASSPHGRKVSALREILAARGWRVVAIDLNVPSFEELSFEAMVRAASEAAHRERPTVLAGSSLGALVALETVRRGLAVPLVLVAPAFALAQRWREKLPPGDPLVFFHHGDLRDRTIHRAFFEEMAHVAPERDPPSQPVTVIMGSLDESVPFEGVRSTWRAWTATGRLLEGSEFIAIDGGDHGLVAHVGLIADAITPRPGAAPDADAAPGSGETPTSS